MEYFSDEFISGLRTKSNGFQNKFKEIIGDIDEYFDIEDEKREFHRLVEIAHFYDKPGIFCFLPKSYFAVIIW